MKEVVVRAEKLGKKFGTHWALEEVSFTLGRGEVLGIVGSDGAGKTTLLRLLAGLALPTRGEAEVLGALLTPTQARGFEGVRSRLGYLPQGAPCYGELTVYENISFFSRLFSGTSRAQGDRVASLLELTGLAPFRNRLAEHLSGGMRQKLALACALVSQPELLLLDEPTTGVDPVARAEFWELLSHLGRERGFSIILATPYLVEAARCDRLVLLHEGRVLASARPEELSQRARGGSLEDAFLELLSAGNGPGGLS